MVTQMTLSNVKFDDYVEITRRVKNECSWVNVNYNGNQIYGNITFTSRNSNHTYIEKDIMKIVYEFYSSRKEEELR
jgi:hypothetical protein